jgi:hypothetical protein
MEVSNPGVDRRIGILPSSPKWRSTILMFLAVMAAVSTFVAIKEAVSTGTDFQWSGAHLLAQHQDPWRTYIDGDPQRQIILGQQPNYLAEFYLMLGPLGRMPFPKALVWWCGLNLVFLAGNLFLLQRMFTLDRDHTLLLTFLVLSSTPFRVTMSNGQHGIFILLMLTLVFYMKSRWTKGVALGISFGKYSFSPLVVMLLLVKKRLDVVLISTIPPLIGLLIAWRMLGGKLKTLAFEPIATSKLAMGPGNGDIMTPLEIFLRNHGVAAAQTYTIPALFGLIVAMGVAVWIGRNKRLDERMQLAVVLVMTLFCFKHVLYDFVVLMVPVAAALMAPKSRARALVLVCMVHFWFITTIVNRFFPARVYAPEVIIYSLLLLAMGIATSHLYPRCRPDETVRTTILTVGKDDARNCDENARDWVGPRSMALESCEKRN